MDLNPANKMCSFCAKQGKADTEFVGGLGAMICLDCLEYYHARVQSPATKEAMRRPPWESMTDTELLATLPQLLRSADQVNAFAAEWVDMIRARKVSWAEIGKALGVSRQAAWERYGHRNDARQARGG
jgi:hypothetical protein